MGEKTIDRTISFSQSEWAENTESVISPIYLLNVNFSGSFPIIWLWSQQETYQQCTWGGEEQSRHRYNPQKTKV